MPIRRLIAAAAVAAIALMPLNSHALGEEKRQVPGSSCTIGDSTLTFDADLGQWFASTDLTCLKADGSPALQSKLDLSFQVFRPEGVNTTQSTIVTGSTVIGSRDINGNSVLSCSTCHAIQAQGSRATLAPGLYVMAAQAVVVQPSGIARRGSYSSCFLVRGDFAGPADKIPGCTL